MRAPRRFTATVAACALISSLVLIGAPARADPNPMLDPANGHPALDTGKALPHASASSEVTFDDERTLAADTQAGAASDGPPDATVSALGCANRGSVTNPRVNQDCTLRRQAEEQVTVNPLDASNVIVGQNDSRIGFNHCGFDYSLDGGAHFGDGLPPFFQHLSPIGHTYDAASDPAVTVDGTGRAWFSCVIFDVNSNASGLAVVPSTARLKGSAYRNIGAGPSPFIVTETASGTHFFDKEFIAADKRAGQTAVYVTFTDFVSSPSCKRSFNRGGFCESPIMLSKWTGTAFTTPIQISGRSPLCVLGNFFDAQLPADSCDFDQGSFPVVLPDGSVFVVFSNFNTTTLVNQQLGVHVSADLTAIGAPVQVGLDDESTAALCDFGRGPEQCVDSLNIRSDDFPALALDPTNGSHLVAVWTDTRAASVTGNYDIVLSESTDGGATWSDGGGGGGTVLTTAGAYFEPSVTVASNGKLVVSTYRANTAHHTATVGDGTFGYGYFVRSAGFSAYTNASDSQTNQSPQANPAQRGFLGDYSSIAAAPSGGVVHMVWSDTRNADTFGRPDEDVFMFTVTIP